MFLLVCSRCILPFYAQINSVKEYWYFEGSYVCSQWAQCRTLKIVLVGCSDISSITVNSSPLTLGQWLIIPFYFQRTLFFHYLTKIQFNFFALRMKKSQHKEICQDVIYILIKWVCQMLTSQLWLIARSGCIYSPQFPL